MVGGKIKAVGQSRKNKNIWQTSLQIRFASLRRTRCIWYLLRPKSSAVHFSGTEMQGPSEESYH